MTHTPPVVSLPDAAELARDGYNAAAVEGLLYVRALSDEELLQIARDVFHDSPAYQTMQQVMGPDTNPQWIVSTAAEHAYERGLIDEAELDWITK